MRTMKMMLATMLLVAAAGCVTINVYFPAAAAEKAAQKFIGDVIGPEGAPVPAASTPTPASPASVQDGVGMLLLNAVFPAAHAAGQQPDLKVSTPAIEALRGKMRARYASGLKELLDSGAIGFTRDGLVALRDAGSVPLAKRNQVRQLVDAENQDRNAVYRQIAAANGHPEWEGKIRTTFAEQWRDMAHSGWYYQDASGNWQRK